jgi:transposase-like protein
MLRKVKHYTDDFKLKVVKEYLETDISKKDIMSKYGIRGCGNINTWMLKFGLNYPPDDRIELNRVMAEEKDKELNEKELETKIQELEKALSYERLRNQALNTLIDVAERDLKISIRKKSGSRQ